MLYVVLFLDIIYKDSKKYAWAMQGQEIGRKNI